MSKYEKITIGIAALALVIALGVATYATSSVRSLSVYIDDLNQSLSQAMASIGIKLGGTTNLDTLVLGEEIGFVASSTNVTPQSASTSPFIGAGRLYLGSGQRIDSWFNPTGQPVNIFMGAWGWNSGRASSSIRISVFSSTTPAARIVPLYDYTALTETINASNTFMVRNYIYATSTQATTTNSLMILKGDGGQGMVTVPSNGWLHFLVQQGDLLPNCATSENCSTSTSTTRGIGDFFLRFIYFRDIY